MLDILFINITNPTQNYQNLSVGLSALEPPVWAGMLGGSLKKLGWEINILDSDAEGISPQETANKIQNEFKNIKLVVFVIYGQQPSASTQNLPAALKTLKCLRELSPEQPVIFIGLHPSALPKQTLLDMKKVCPDSNKHIYVCKGEGVHTLHTFLQNNLNPKNILGLHYVDNNEYIYHYPAENLKYLDIDLPGIIWDMLPMDKYRAHNWHCNFGHTETRYPYASIYTSLGCPFRCSFCCINAPFGKPGYRYWSVDHVINELDILANNYGIKNLKFADELFVLNPKRTIELCDKIIERKYGFNIWAYARIDTCKPELLEKLKKAGVNWVALGIESGNSNIRQKVSKGLFKKNDIFDVVRGIKSFDISVLGNYMFGLPEDTLETMKQTLDLALDLQCEYSNFYTTMAYPGSQLYSLLENQNYLSEKNTGWEGYSQMSYNCSPLPTNTLTSADVLKFRDKAFITYHTNTNYLNMIKNKFGEVALQGIHKMLDVPLKRKILEI